MTMHRLLGPTPAGPYNSMDAHGRTYSAGAGQPLDVPAHDATVLTGNGWIFVALSGPASARSAEHVAPGGVWYATELGRLITTDGTTWRDPATGQAV